MFCMHGSQIYQEEQPKRTKIGIKLKVIQRVNGMSRTKQLNGVNKEQKEKHK